MAAFDPASITDVENFMSEAWDHAAIKAALDAMDTRTTAQIANTWSKYSSDAVGAMNAFDAAFRQEIPENWSGRAAEAVRSRVEEYSNTRLNVALQLGGVATSLFSAIDAVATLKGKIGAPAQRASVEQYEAMAWSGNSRSAADAALEAQARVDMQTLYPPAYQHTDSRVPSFDPPPPLGSAPEPDPGRPQAQSDGSPEASPIDATSETDSSEQSDGGTESVPENSSPTNAAPTSTTPASTLPASAGTGPGGESGQPRSWMQNPGEAAAGSRAGSGAAGGYSPGSGGGGYGSSGYGQGAAQRTSGFGTPANPGAATAAGSAPSVRGGAAASGGARGMGAVGMGGIGAARAQGGDDKEHQTPDYLINVDNGNELIGKLPPVAPPVIGG
ncbi:hypothetical protein BFN03_18535 [Rhodococcus sp. WMMA185]|uniref:hypothetical protein n=1 Tax=Rhodococcus sp. WMMA185 TaxID=679318 RepID=UPI000877E9E5|nr:hypothetical protein [Rhodococcus sp. WMMA185]AOW93987.1 hypothetical protein BFN03_18535 [Rhodococcus sp. WMMA185]